jgi:hypothetical protein
MESVQSHLQLIISMMLVVGAACVALICDFLKRNNEQLRELTIELKVRQEQEQMRAALPVPAPAVKPAETASFAEEPAAPPAPKQRATVGQEKRAGREKKRTVNSDAMAAMERGAALAGSGKRPRAASVETSPAKAMAEVEIPEVQAPEPVRESVVAAAKKDWSSILSRGAKSEPKSAEPITQTFSTATPSLPSGFQDGFVLNKLVRSRQPVSGLVVSIGVNATRKADGALPEQVCQLVQSLIGPGDFAAQSAEDEFLLIYPQERGASAQRKLSQIAQKLWDFQLRSLGSFQILFSWGGVEVQKELLEEAIASASERMQETKRGRKLLTMALPTSAAPSPEQNVPLRQAV